MFTGIVETTGRLKQVISNDSNRILWIESPISTELKKDQSVNHNGVCLTVEEVIGETHRVTAIEETLKKSNLGKLEAGDLVNLERCLKLNDRLDGHLVQGHVDATGTCQKIVNRNGSFEYEIEFPKKYAGLLVEKGSICLNGISLTAYNLKRRKFTVAIIPYTYEHTNIHLVNEGDSVNLEFDIVGKYLLRSLTLNKKL